MKFVAVIFVATVVSAAPKGDIPNVILLLSDDMGFGDVGFTAQLAQQPGAGGKAWTANPPHTPNLDAWASANSTLVFDRFYSGSAVCSPTRSSCLTGRTPNRECIFSAEGCGTMPAYSCNAPLPLPPTTFTLAEAAKQAGLATIHVGKWHLGNLMPVPDPHAGYAEQKWHTSHPGVHGFDEWHSTIASAPSSTTNCGCNPEWPKEGKGCIVGGGKWERTAETCTNYWSPTDLDAHHQPTRPECHMANTSTFDCVQNYTQLIPGDDTEFIMDRFEEFLVRKTTTEPGGFFAALWTHTNHVPHPSLPEYFHMYTDKEGQPAGDYLGTITQMDVQIGRLRAMLEAHGVLNNTIVWYTADNGPHTDSEEGDRDSVQAANGLRQCKASLFEGGIHVPGFVSWPASITTNRHTSLPVSTNDYMPTVLEAWGVAHPQPTWASDGQSIMPLLQGASVSSRSPFGFQLGQQVAYMDGEHMKLVVRPEKGQCKTLLPPYDKKHLDGPFLFNITADPTESHDLSAEMPDVTAKLKAAMDAFTASVVHSQQYESLCEPQPNKVE